MAFAALATQQRQHTLNLFSTAPSEAMICFHLISREGVGKRDNHRQMGVKERKMRRWKERERERGKEREREGETDRHTDRQRERQRQREREREDQPARSCVH